MSISALRDALLELQKHPCPSVPSPDSTPKRASVALIIRVQPHPDHPPYLDPSGLDIRRPNTIEKFFDCDWVAYGEPELLFIKRAAREGDRWTSHVALPGGKRDPEDAGDYDAAVRECYEEVGWDVEPDCIPCGKLPDRLVTTSWGTFPLMTLCPFVFLSKYPSTPKLLLQQTEVASAHWVPLRVLLTPAFRTVEKCDVSDRLTRRATGVLGRIVRLGLRLSLGYMEFAAVRLWPSESIYSTFGKDFMAPVESGLWDKELLLWGLTLGVIEDFLEIVPPGGHTMDLWTYPTFTATDVRGVIAAMTSSLREKNKGIARSHNVAAAMTLDQSDSNGSGLEDEDVGESTVLVRGATPVGPTTTKERSSSVMLLMEGYYDIVRRAVWITLFGRTIIATAAIGVIAWRRLRK